MNRVMITGTGSGCGKTTVTCALLSALRETGRKTVSFKCGPDYIDPMFHREITGVDAYNLDPFFCGPGAMRAHIARRRGGIAVMEGAMGYYDGIACTDRASAYEAARETSTPVILIVNAKSAANSAGAVIEGFVNHRKDSGIRGVIFNGISQRRYSDMSAVARSAGVRPMGFLPHNPEFSIDSRHLGLVTAAEVDGLRGKMRALGETAKSTLDLEGVMELAASAPVLEDSAPLPDPLQCGPVIAVARDEAFCFIYRENLELLEDLGCTLRFFSPLRDSAIPGDADALYLCGGYPELYAERLSGNRSMLASVRAAVCGGMPAIAECGGFMYLHEELDGHPMTGAVEGGAFKTERLQRFGYAVLRAGSDNLLCGAGDEIRVHEFHYWESGNPGRGFEAGKTGRGGSYACAHASDTLYAGFPHLYFPSKPEMAERFAKKALEYRERRA